MKLYNYFRSSASYRVRIALNLNGLVFDYVPVHLSRDGGEQFIPAFRAVNAQALVPVLQSGDDTLTQSLAILEYLDEVYPEPPLLPATPGGRARVRSLAQAIACDIHPLNNLRVLRYLTGKLGLSDEAKTIFRPSRQRDVFAMTTDRGSPIAVLCLSSTTRGGSNAICLRTRLCWPSKTIVIPLRRSGRPFPSGSRMAWSIDRVLPPAGACGWWPTFALPESKD
jgi:hypothetical protein